MTEKSVNQYQGFFMRTESWAIRVPIAFFTRARNDKFSATWWGFGTVKVFHEWNIQNSSHNRFLDYIPACCIHVCGCYSPVCCSFLHAHFNIFVFTNRHSLKSISIESFWRMLAHPQATLIGGRVQKVTHLSFDNIILSTHRSNQWVISVRVLYQYFADQTDSDGREKSLQCLAESQWRELMLRSWRWKEYDYWWFGSWFLM